MINLDKQNHERVLKQDWIKTRFLHILLNFSFIKKFDHFCVSYSIKGRLYIVSDPKH